MLELGGWVVAGGVSTGPYRFRMRISAGHVADGGESPGEEVMVAELVDQVAAGARKAEGRRGIMQSKLHGGTIPVCQRKVKGAGGLTDAAAEVGKEIEIWDLGGVDA